MKDHHTYENGLKYKPDYKWPEKDTVEICPRCNDTLELISEHKAYFGKPWWCTKCQWQFSVEDLENINSKKEKKI